MKRILLISLSFVLALAGWTTAHSEDGFYVIAGQKANYAPVPRTGETTPYAAGADGHLRMGVTWPTPRFIDNNNGTVTDRLTGLIWLKNAYDIPKNWQESLSAAAAVADGNHSLTDGSKAGDWRMPNIRELQSLVDYSAVNPALPAVNPFVMVLYDNYWSSTTSASGATNCWGVNFSTGDLSTLNKSIPYYLWCVRGGKGETAPLPQVR